MKSEWITVLVAGAALGTVMLVGSVGNASNERGEADAAMQAAAEAWLNGDHGQTPKNSAPSVDPRDFDISEASPGPFLPYDEWIEQQQKVTRKPHPSTAKPLKAKGYDKKAAREWAQRQSAAAPTDPLSQLLTDGGSDLGGSCTPGYVPCLPPVYDYDCRYGGGDGPSYTGQVWVQRGMDRYGLDADGDGIGCNGQ
jgi:hypothetical protein